MTNDTPDLDIRMIRLDNGENLVSIISAETDEIITLLKPVVFYIEFDRDEGKQEIHVQEYLPVIVTDDISISISKSRVVYSTAVNKEFRGDYIKSVDCMYDICNHHEAHKSQNSNNITNIIQFNNQKPH